MPAAAVNPESILRELRDLWEQLGKDQKPGASNGVLRACSMTLIVAAEGGGDQSDAEEARRTIGVLMHDHPSRAIVLCSRESADLSARVFSECWMPFGRQQQICTEGMEVTADPVNSEEVARLLVPLIVPDLPVVLWCRGGRAFVDRSLDALFPLADKIVFDSAEARYAPAAVDFLRRLRKQGHRVGDLAWTRLTGWREVVAHMFDPADESSADANAVREVKLTHGGGKAASSAQYLATWIERTLPGTKVTTEVVEGIQGLRSVAFSGEDVDLELSLAPPNFLEARSGSRKVCSVLPPVTEEALMREELSILNSDPAFDRVLR